jgi:Cu2+-exporting ATPase
LGNKFCCNGCEKAYELIHDLKLDNFYLRRALDPLQSAIKPDGDIEENDLCSFISEDAQGVYTLYLFVEKLHCASCVWLIEQALLRQLDVDHARINMSTRRLVLRWRGDKNYGNHLAYLVHQMGYRLKPFDPSLINSHDRDEDAFLLRCLAVAGFAAGNVMLLSVSLWASSTATMGEETRALMHWVSGIIAMPAVIYAGQPFFKSALNALRNKHTNIDVPISLALILTTFVSLYETVMHGEHAYFDSVVMLLFFLLIGRYLDRRARSRAREAAEGMMTMFATSAKIIENGVSRIIPGRDLIPDMILEVAAGERVAADGIILQGKSELDTSLITGESMPEKVFIGSTVFAGTLNISNPLKIKVTQCQENTLLSEIIRLMERAEQKKSRYIRLADKVTRVYTPVVHILAIASFSGWVLNGMAWPQATLVATTVLIITCPCALALAVPVVQVITSGKLFRQGIFIKSGDALERLSTANIIAFDKTGTLTLGRPELKNPGALTAQQYQLAASMAEKSRHPMAKAIQRRYQGPLLDLEITETSGYGLESLYQGQKIRLGNRAWCNVADDALQPLPYLSETWFVQGENPPVQLLMKDQLRPDAAKIVQAFKSAGIEPVLLSGDRHDIVKHVAEEVGLSLFYAELNPARKIAHLQVLEKEGKNVFMVGDGLNDAPALMGAHVSMSPATALDITQSAADIIFQGENLSPVLAVWQAAKKSQQIVRQNIVVSIGYNVVAVPLAMMGHVTPLIAALAMSSSSLIVILNSFRVKK